MIPMSSMVTSVCRKMPELVHIPQLESGKVKIQIQGDLSPSWVPLMVQQRKLDFSHDVVPLL